MLDLFGVGTEAGLRLRWPDFEALLLDRVGRIGAIARGAVDRELPLLTLHWEIGLWGRPQPIFLLSKVFS